MKKNYHLASVKTLAIVVFLVPLFLVAQDKSSVFTEREIATLSGQFVSVKDAPTYIEDADKAIKDYNAQIERCLAIAKRSQHAHIQDVTPDHESDPACTKGALEKAKAYIFERAANRAAAAQKLASAEKCNDTCLAAQRLASAIQRGDYCTSKGGAKFCFTSSATGFDLKKVTEGDIGGGRDFGRNLGDAAKSTLPVPLKKADVFFRVTVAFQE